MKLSAAISEIQKRTEDEVILAKKPFTLESDSIISVLDNDLGVPAEITLKGYSYFLEQFLVEDLIENAKSQNIPEGKHVELVLHYGIYDAYPDWCYQYNNGNQPNA